MTQNVMDIGCQRAVISYDPEIGILRGEFIGLIGGAYFYPEDLKTLRTEGDISLRAFMTMCEENGIEPLRRYFGRSNLRLDPKRHEAAALAAKAERKSLNDWVSDAIDRATSTR